MPEVHWAHTWWQAHCGVQGPFLLAFIRYGGGVTCERCLASWADTGRW